MRRTVWAILLTFVCSALAWGQAVTPPPAKPDPVGQAVTPPPAKPDPAGQAVTPAKPDPAGQVVAPPPTVSSPAPSISVPLTVPTGTPLQVALDKEVRIQKAGQPIHGKVVAPVYAFDKLVVPVGSEVTGKVTRVEPIPGKKRTIAGMNANFSPDHDVQVEFDELVLTDGRHVPLHITVSPGSDAVLQFVPANEEKGKKAAAKKVVSQQASEARQEIKREWETAKQQVHEPGKMHRLERLAVAQLPVHPQYMDPGLRFNADLEEPLDFGKETLTPEAVASVGTPPPAGSMVHALLVTPLSSATTKKGAPVEAVITQPLIDSGHLILPQGSRLLGSVSQVRPARNLGRNGLLRIVFHQVAPPSGLQQKVEASLEGVEAAAGEHLTLDSEGGAEVTTPKTRYLTTGISVALAAASSRVDSDDPGGGVAGTTKDRVAGGATGFKLVGIALGVFVHSQPLGFAMGAYGASMRLYSNFLARGRDVVFPKDTAMVIGFGTRASPAAKPAESPVTIGPLPMAPRLPLWPLMPPDGTSASEARLLAVPQ